jgi:DNA-binding GntR family transcriptional regulator
LRAWIIDGTLTSCEVLRDADLAQAFGISRTPVREALLHLEHEGLVESQPGRWTRVTALDPELLTNLFPVWAELEALVARLAASRIGSTTGTASVEDAAREYAAAVDAMLVEPGEAHRRVARAADADFHAALLDAAGNPVLASTLAPLRLTVRRFDAACPMPVTLGADSVDQHGGIVAAILAGDPETAASRTRDHLDYVHRRLCAGWDVAAG